jgi:hypothetical protein
MVSVHLARHVWAQTARESSSRSLVRTGGHEAEARLVADLDVAVAGHRPAEPSVRPDPVQARDRVSRYGEPVAL